MLCIHNFVFFPARFAEHQLIDLPWCLSGKEFACNAQDPGSIPELERSLGKGNGNPLYWEISQTEKPSRLQSIGSQSDTTKQMS